LRSLSPTEDRKSQVEVLEKYQNYICTAGTESLAFTACLSGLPLQELSRRPDKLNRLFSPQLRDVDVEHGTDLAECGVDVGSQSVHSNHGSESNQGDNQRVFHQALDSFVLVQPENQILHLSSP
jgi:hypothetical protein